MIVITLNPETAAEEVEIYNGKGCLSGTLERAMGENSYPVALIISGSGLTDKDGNHPLLGKNNCLKMLAKALALQGIASLRYDSHGLVASKLKDLSKNDLRFEDSVNDATLWCKLLRNKFSFSHLFIISYSEGSLIGMQASRKVKADGLVSIAGPAYPASTHIWQKLRTNLPEDRFRLPESIKGKLWIREDVEWVHPELEVLFGKNVQPSLISCFTFDPRKQLSKLDLPVLIIHGTHDLQVPVEHAILLSMANKSADLALIEGMNHVLKSVPAIVKLQKDSYNNPSLPITPALVNRIVAFSKKICKND